MKDRDRNLLREALFMLAGALVLGTMVVSVIHRGLETKEDTQAREENEALVRWAASNPPPVAITNRLTPEPYVSPEP